MQDDIKYITLSENIFQRLKLISGRAILNSAKLFDFACDGIHVLAFACY